jgi:putative transposase
VSPLQRTWALRGQTPTRLTSLSHKERLNLIGGIGVTPARHKIKLHLQSYRKSITGEEVIRFLAHLLQAVRGTLILVWDKHPIHRRAKVKDFIAHHPRLHVYQFPTAAPELNPTEFVWTQINEYTTGTAPHNATELRSIVFAAIARTRRSSSRLWACIHASHLPWKRSRLEH